MSTKGNSAIECVSVAIKPLRIIPSYCEYGETCTFDDLPLNTTSINDIKQLYSAKYNVSSDKFVFQAHTLDDALCPSRLLKDIPSKEPKVFDIEIRSNTWGNAYAWTSLLTGVYLESYSCDMLNHLLITSACNTLQHEWDEHLSHTIWCYAFPVNTQSLAQYKDICLRWNGSIHKERDEADNFCIYCKKWTYDKMYIDHSLLPLSPSLERRGFYGLFLDFEFRNYSFRKGGRRMCRVSADLDIEAINNGNIRELITMNADDNTPLSFDLYEKRVETTENDPPRCWHHEDGTRIEFLGIRGNKKKYVTLQVNTKCLFSETIEKLFAENAGKLKVNIIIKHDKLPMKKTAKYEPADRCGVIHLEHYIYKL
eukprot:247728_1